MPSPLPGMDPWLERPGVFPGFHNTFLAYLREAINAVLPPPYFADLANRVVIEGDGDPGLREPDVGVFRPVGANGSHGPAGGGGVAVAVLGAEAAPILVHVPRDETTEWVVEIRTTDAADRLVTAIELLSPTNKGGGRTEYRRKQRELIERRVNLVELDLLRAGPHTTAIPPVPARRDAGPFDYHICVTDPERPEDFAVYPIRLPQRLPTLAVPLKPGTDPVRVPLQPVIDRSYDAGLYARRLRYDQPPDPPLSAEHAAWAVGVLRAKGLLPGTEG
ncbi:MAG: DUF4058 family protein [Fimbriiglobus sp.]